MIEENQMSETNDETFVVCSYDNFVLEDGKNFFMKRRYGYIPFYVDLDSHLPYFPEEFDEGKGDSVHFKVSEEQSTSIYELFYKDFVCRITHFYNLDTENEQYVALDVISCSEEKAELCISDLEILLDFEVDLQSMPKERLERIIRSDEEGLSLI